MFTLFVFDRGISCLIIRYLCLQGSSSLIYVICVCRRAPVLFMLFVFVGGALVLFTLFVFVEELMSFLRYLCL